MTTAMILALLSACATKVRDVTFCKLVVTDSFETSKVYCARNDDQWEATLKDIDGFFATDEESLRKIGDKLEDCEANCPGTVTR